MKLQNHFTLLLIFFFCSTTLQGQNTVGLLSYDITQSYKGYTMIYPHNQPNVYIIDNLDSQEIINLEKGL